MNKSDSERIAAVLGSAGYKPVSKSETADLIVVNMCSVRQSAVDRVFGLAPKFNKLKTINHKLKTILSGCILKKDKERFKKNFDYIFDIKYLSKWPEILKKSPSLKMDDRPIFTKAKKSYLGVTPGYKNKFSAFVPISNGCVNFCSYCVVPFTRGPLICKDHEEILKEIKCLVKKGFKEIWLLGQNVNDYHSPSDSSVNFTKLFRVVENIKGNFRIFFLSPNPKNFSEELIDTLSKSKKFGKRLNLPVQSGDNKILQKMNRPYTVAQYKNLVKKIRKKIPDIDLSTDVIVGFPGETKKQFENTVKLFKEVSFNIAYIAKYSPRPGTVAFKMKDNIFLKEKKRREKILMGIIKKTMSKKIVVILGPTSSGKTDLSIKLALRLSSGQAKKKFGINGAEIVSADSRQVYRGMDIGTGKITKKEMQGVPHYLLDVVSPKKRFDVVQYRNLADKAIEKIFKKNKIPFLVGGTGFYIQAVVDGIIIPEIKPDWKLRKKLEKKPVSELYKMLKKLDSRRANNIDKNNPRRLIRAIEIVLKSKGPIPPFVAQKPNFKALFLGVKKSKRELKKLIEKRLLKRLDAGMINEVRKLHKSGVSWRRLEEFGLEYRYVAQYLQNKLKYDEMITRLQKEIEHYAKRQMTWFKRDKRIKWIKDPKRAEKLIGSFLLTNNN